VRCSDRNRRYLVVSASFGIHRAIVGGVRLQTFVMTLLALLGTSVATIAQTPKTFEVASVRPHSASGNRDWSYPPGGGFVGTAPLATLILLAYELKADTIVGGPDWLRSQLWEINAKSAQPATRDEVHAMLRTLLEERFDLRWRKDPNGKSTVWVLRMERDDGRLGSSIRRTTVDCIKKPGPLVAPISEREMRPGLPVPCGVVTDTIGGVVAGGGAGLDRVVFYLRLALKEEVIDQTGLTGSFDFFARLPPTIGDQKDRDDVSIFTAVREQFGMKLQREEVTREVFVIERASRPTPN
jgi:uncharacterized protein (TIGR03435 family)